MINLSRFVNIKPLVAATAAGALLAGCLALVTPLAAAEFPTRAIRLICGFAPGTSTDVLARALAQKMSEHLGQTVVVETMPGSNGVLAATNVAKAAPDGYTIMLITGSHVGNAAIGKKLSFHPVDGFAPILLFARSYGLALISNQGATSVPELVKVAKAEPGKLTYATSGVGNITHVAGALFEKSAGIELINVPYNSPTLATDVVGRQVDMAFISAVVAVPLIKDGKVKALAMTGPKRIPALPDVPTLQELGFKDFDVTGYFGLVAPAKTPDAVIQTLYSSASKALATPEVAKLIADSGLYADPLGPVEFTSFMREDLKTQTQLMQQLGIKVE